ncbi:MAG: radical SAM protein [Parcubacteria group bacterium]|jgi:MoaA/NifB/PqqE/SkfB family radical SAM enzyme
MIIQLKTLNKVQKKIKKAVIIAGYQCNNKCQFCTSSAKRDILAKSTRQIMAEMISLRKKAFTYLEIIGGEATIRPDIIELIGFARHLKFKQIVMATNGRIFSYKDFSRKIVEAGLSHLIFSIHGHNSRLHDSLTCSPGSFEQLMAGVKNIRDLGLEISTNTTIVKQNYRHLSQIGKFLLEIGSKNAEFIFVDPTHGAVKENFLHFVPKISVAAPYIKKCLDLGKNKNIHWHVRYVPLCYFSDYVDQISELKESVTFHTEHLAPDFVNNNVTDARRTIARTKTEKCEGCALYDICEGIWNVYLEHYGDKELNPIQKTS